MRVLVVALLLGTEGCATTAVELRPGRSVEIEHAFFANSYTQDGRVLKMDSLDFALATIPDTQSAHTRAKAESTVGTILAILGGSSIGYVGGAAAAGHTPDNAALYLGVGGGLAVAAICFAILADASLATAVEQYNSAISRRNAERPM